MSTAHFVVLAYREWERLPTLVPGSTAGVPAQHGVEDPVPLSEEELRLLEQMERALVEEDPKFASTLRGTTMRRAARRRAVLAGLGFAVGIAVLMGGAISGYWWVGIVGFVIMLGSATIGLSAMRGQRVGGGADASMAQHPSGFGVVQGGKPSRRGANRPRSGSGFMDTLRVRWRRRREQGGF